MAGHRRPRLPAEPVLALAAQRGMTHMDLGRSLAAVRSTAYGQRAVERAVSSGVVTVDMADELAIALGCHPGEVWGWATWEEGGR